MSFKDCLDSAVEAKRLSDDRATSAKSAYDAAYDEGLADGLDEGAAADYAAQEATKRINAGNKQRRWQKINELRRAHAIQQRLQGNLRPDKEIEAIGADLEANFETVRSFAMAEIDRLLRDFKPRAFVTPSFERQFDQIIDAAYGKSGDPDAKQGADAILNLMETLRDMANAAGASIPRLKVNRLPQTHDAVKVNAVDMKVWVDDHLENLDWDIMRFEGLEVPASKRREVLERTYEGITSDGKLREDFITGGATPNLAGRLSRDRFLHYKDADSYKAMQKKYGAGNLYEQVIAMVDNMAKDISTLRVLGPSPDSMREFARRVAEQEGHKQGRDFGKKTERAANTFDKMYRIHMRQVESAEGNLWVQSFSGLRTFVVGAKLGGVAIPSFFGDIGNAKFARQLNGMPVSGLLRQYSSEVLRGNVAKSEAIRLGVIAEDSVSLASSRIRYFGALDGPYVARLFSDKVYRIGLAAQHTQIVRNAEGKQFLGFLADSAGTKFDNHPLAPAMLQAGITEADWNLMRAFPKTDVNGAKFLVPLDMHRAGDDTQKQVAIKFSNMMQTYMKLAVPDPTLRARVTMGEAIDPNSALGQITRTMTSLLSFPIALMYGPLRGIARAPRNKAVLGGAYFAWMTGAGAFITQAKSLVSSNQPYDMSFFDEDDKLNLDFWGRAMLNGGSLGIVGDLVFNNININNSSYKPGNPTEEYLKTLHKMTLDNVIDAANGDDLELGADALDLFNESVPKFWHTKLLMQRGIQDAVQREVDPAGYRARRRYEREHSTGQWWGIGDDPEGINLNAVTGNS